MSVSIEQIVVENLGPLGNQTLELSRFNLIYGRNETGKTYLVEFLLRSLFRHASSFPLRVGLGRGKVTVRGLAEDPTPFTPDGKEKLEDYWDESEAGLPTNMARLMVVKGAELELTDSNAVGIDRAVLKAALSSEALMDRILDRIPATVREATIVDDRIEAHQRGDIKARSTLQDDRQRLSDLSDQVENRYAQGRLRALELSLADVQSELAQQLEAKRHAAYQLQQERAAIQEKRTRLPQEQLEALERDIGRHQDKQAELGRLREKWADAKAAVEHYSWLKQAVELWERRGMGAVGRRGNLVGYAAGAFLIVGLSLLVAGLVLNLTQAADRFLGIMSVVSFGFGIALWALSIARTRRLATTVVNAAERNQIEAEFERRFGHPPGGLAGLKAQEQSLREAQAKFEHLTESIAESGTEVEKLADTVERLFQSLGADKVAPDGWSQVAKQMRDWEASQADKIHQIDLRLSELGVDQSDYRSEPAAIAFSAERLVELEAELEQLDQETRLAQQDLDSLKQEITRETGDDIGAAWTGLLDNLGQRRREADDDYRTTTARILGQIGVFQVLERLRAEEDEKIRAGLQAPEVGELLSEVTGRRRSLDFEGGELVVHGATANYDLSALSTGAREQVLLALRMGFASRLAGGQPLFLLLDDAFQHSDWERRQRLVARVVELAEAGWQVTYLTMDDHLRDLFKNAGEQAFGDSYRFYEI
ncbi:MAG: ATP-binding protein [Anaerolineales bacterium]